MKSNVLVWVALALTMASFTQAKSDENSLASSMDVFVFPAEGQDSSQQSKDEVECYEWAASNTGTDPFDLAKQAEADEQLAQAEKAAAQQTGQGAGAQAAVRGAAAGALIGEIADDDAGKGAAYGATAGVIAGRRRGRQAQQQAVAQAEQNEASREQATAQELENFKNAFSVCLEAKDYMVKY